MINRELLRKFLKGETSVIEEKTILNWIKRNKENEYSFFKQRRKCYPLILNKNPIVSGKHKSLFACNALINVAAILLLITTIGLLVNKQFIEIKRYNQLNTLIVPQEQYCNTKIEIESNDLPDNTYTGRFRLSDVIDYALREMNKQAIMPMINI